MKQRNLSSFITISMHATIYLVASWHPYKKISDPAKNRFVLITALSVFFCAEESLNILNPKFGLFFFNLLHFSYAFCPLCFSAAEIKARKNTKEKKASHI